MLKTSERKRQKKGFWRSPLEDEASDKPQFRADSQKEKTASVFLVALDAINRKILLVHKFDELASWGLPGGGVEPGESLEQAIYRETRDESGHLLKAKLGERSKVFLGLETAELLAVYQINQMHEKAIFVDIVDPKENPVIKEVEEIDKVGWFTLEEIMDKFHVPYDENSRDSESNHYVKESHREYILVALRFLGFLEAFGFKEAAIEDYLVGELPENFQTPAVT